MADNLTPQNLTFPLTVLLSYVLLVTIIVMRRGSRGANRASLSYLVVAAGLVSLCRSKRVALENASLLDRVHRRAEQPALLNEIAWVITSSLNLEPAVDLIAERIESTFKVAAGFIFLLDESWGVLVLQSACLDRHRERPAGGRPRSTTAPPGRGVANPN
jgi:hypothetical protein